MTASDGALGPSKALAEFLLMDKAQASFNHVGPSHKSALNRPRSAFLDRFARCRPTEMQTKIGKASKLGGYKPANWPNRAERKRILEQGLNPPQREKVPDGPAADDPSADFVLSCVRAADARKARDIIAMHVAHLTAAAGFFVNMVVNSKAQMGAVVSSIEKDIWEEYEVRPNRQGKANTNWVLLDFGDVVVNIFTEEARVYYNLEGLWEDAQILDLSDVVTPNSPSDVRAAEDDFTKEEDDDWTLDEDDWKLDDDDWKLDAEEDDEWKLDDEDDGDDVPPR